MKIWQFDTDKCWDYENGFYLTSHITRIPKLLAHYELYKKIINLPGDVIELGVYKGASFCQWLTFREVLESPFSRKIIGFDAFGTFPTENINLDSDKKFIEKFENQGGHGVPVDDLHSFLNKKEFKNYELIKGDVSKTLSGYLETNPEKRFSLVHFDFDVYEPTKLSLELLKNRLVPGALLVFDDFATVSGETKAVEEFFKGEFEINKLPISHIPSFIKI